MQVTANVQHDYELLFTMKSSLDKATTLLAQLLLRNTNSNAPAKATEPNAYAP
jgi:hypothetical protein